MRTRFSSASIGLLLAAVLLAVGCAGIEPYQPRNFREEGPEKGLISGSEGAFVIYRKGGGAESDKDGYKQ